MRAGIVKASRQAFAILAVGLLLTAATKPAETLTGKVVKVADGDTVTLLVGTEQIRVRLWGIDAPEKGQAFGNRAKQALSDTVFGRAVRVDDLGKDKYGRTLGIIRLGDKNINLELVREGWAWWYRQYAPRDRELAAAEESARNGKRGLWADRDPVPPWSGGVRRSRSNAAFARSGRFSAIAADFTTTLPPLAPSAPSTSRSTKPSHWVTAYAATVWWALRPARFR